MRIIISFFGFCIAALAMTAGAHAQQLIDSYTHWKVFTTTQGGNKLCYIASVPVKKTGNYTKRDDPYLLVTHRNSTTDEVSTSSGYSYKKNSDVVANIDKNRHKMFTKGELAWAYDAAQDKSMIQQMIRGNTMVLKGTSWKGTTSTDTYSLSGFTAAYKRMKSVCK